MKGNTAWNYSKGLVTFVPLFFLTQFIVMSSLIYLYGKPSMVLGEGVELSVQMNKYFNVIATFTFAILYLIPLPFLIKKINMPVKFVYDLNGSYLELHTINNHLFGFGNSNKKIKCDRYNKAQIFKIKYLGGENPVTYYSLEIKDREGNDTGRLNYISSENVVKDIAKIVGFTLPDTSSYIAKDGDVVDTSDWGYSKY